MILEWIEKYDSTKWSGAGELWLDPMGNEVIDYECSLVISSDAISYNWIYESESKQGKFLFSEGEVSWSDSWHQPETVVCSNVVNTRGLFTIEYSYSGSNDESWGWRMILSRRPDGNLVLQMTNIAPWGEVGRAVRMVFKKNGS